MNYDDVISFDNLYKALHKVCNNVRWKASVVGYEYNGLENTYKLRRSLVENTYHIDKYQRFTIYEPKKREIVATRIKDRQFQRSLCDNYLYQSMTRPFTTDNCACLKKRGVDYALNRMTEHMRKYYRHNGKKGYILKCDVKSFFSSIDHDVAKVAVKKRTNDIRVQERVFEIIDSFGEGLGLGSEVSQLIALAVLDDLDHFVKEQLHIKYYIRYVDDFILLHPDKEYLKYCKEQIEIFLSRIKLGLNQRKTIICPISQGVKFLQWKFILTDSGKVVKLIDKKKVYKQKRKLRKLLIGEIQGRYAIGTADQSLQSWDACARRGNTYFVRKNMNQFYQNLKEEIKYEQHLSENSKA